MSKVKTSNGYKDIDEVYSGSTYITEIYDKNGNKLYTADREIQGDSTLTFKSRGKNLKNYRIYGNTVNGESVGDRTGNLFDISTIVEGKYINPSGVEAVSTASYQANVLNHTSFINVSSNTNYSLLCNMPYNLGLHNTIAFCWFDSNKTFISRNTKSIESDKIDLYSFSGQSPSNAVYLIVNFIGYVDGTTYMLNTGSEPLPYEPYGYRVPVTVEGKNLLLNTATSQGINGVTFTVNSDGSVTCNGTASATTFFTCSSNITISKKAVLTGCPNDGGFDKYSIKVQKRSTSDTIVNDLGVGSGEFYQTDPIDVVIRIAKGYTCDNLTFYPMIRKADIEDDTYEPYHAPVTTPIYLPEQIKMVGDEAEYIDYEEQKQHRVRKNLLQNTATSQTINGVTFTVNGDGSVTCNGTASNAIYFSFATNLESGTYIISGTPRGMTENNAVIFINANYSTIGLSNNVIDNDGNGKQFVATQSGTATLTITIKSDYTCDNLTFYPMIRKADIEDDTYEPYIENTELDVILPALPTLSGTITLSVGTEVQPSEVYVEGTIRAVS